MSEKEGEGHFYKGIVVGLLGVGAAVLFLQSKAGKRFLKQARVKIDELLAMDTQQDPYDEDYLEITKNENPFPQSSPSSLAKPRIKRTFKKKKK